MTPLELLLRHDLFRDLPQNLLQEVVALIHRVAAPAGQVLFEKGDDGDCFYGLLDGRVQVGCTSESGREVIFSILETGAMFGEIAVLDGGPRTADVAVLEDSELFLIHQGDFLRLIKTQPVLSGNLIRHLCRRLRRSSETIEDAALLGLSARLAKRLLSLCALSGHETREGCHIDIRLSQQELAQMMGVTRESINKHLAAWRENGLIDLARGRIILHDVPALRKIVSEAMDS